MIAGPNLASLPEASTSAGIEYEIELYRKDEGRKSMLAWDPNLFWASRRFEYPKLYKVAKVWLGATATSVKSE